LSFQALLCICIAIIITIPKYSKLALSISLPRHISCTVAVIHSPTQILFPN
jgi:hypothetical protein